MSELKNIPLTNISMIKNYRDVEPPSEKDTDVIELSESIKKHGVMQAVLIRPDKSKKDHYQLIFGHRRFMASKVAKQETIPANIKEIADDDILELQVTENLQRKDVHPMDEAVAFKSLIDKKKYSVEEIALRFAKKPEYIAQRLKLNDLIPELQKRFKTNGSSFLLGHGILLARLQEIDQKTILKERRDFGSVANLSDYIDRNVMRDLGKASFDTKDATLYPQAGACTTCPKRSGCNTLLFQDIKNPDRCMDSNCFATKSSISFIKTLNEIVETKPDVHVVKERWDKVPPKVNEYLQKMKVKVLTEGDHCDDSTYTGSRFNDKAKGFYLNGHQAGKIVNIYLPGKAKGAGSSAATKEKEKSGKLSKSEVEGEIKRIQEREKRSKELDLNKIHAAIEAEVKKNKTKIMGLKPEQIDRGIMIYQLLTEVGYNPDWRNHSMGYVFDKIKELAKWPEHKLSELVRKIVFDKMMHAGSDLEVRNKHTAVVLIAEYAGIDIKAIQEEQKAIAEKRNIRITKRIKELRDSLTNKPAAAKAPVKNKVTKAVPKKEKGKGIKALLK